MRELQENLERIEKLVDDLKRRPKLNYDAEELKKEFRRRIDNAGKRSRPDS